MSDFDIGAINEFVFWEEETSNITNLDNAAIVDAVIVPESHDNEIISPSDSFSLPNPVKQSTTNMYDILDWPETPIRKGTKKVQKTKKSFVITNCIWIEDEANRKEEKRKIEAVKEEKKAERLKKKILKDKERAPKPLTKTKSKINNKKNPKNLPTTTKSHTVTSGILRNCSPERRLLCDIFNTIDNEVITNVTFSPAKHGKNIRNLFTAETVTGDNIGENILCVGQMCFSCTLVMSRDVKSDNCGIRCNNCMREFHTKCLKKKIVFIYQNLYVKHAKLRSQNLCK